MYLGARHDNNRKNKMTQTGFTETEKAQNEPYVPLAGVDNKRKKYYYDPDCTRQTVFVAPGGPLDPNLGRTG